MKRALFALLLCGCDQKPAPPVPLPAVSVVASTSASATASASASVSAVPAAPAFEPVIGEWKEIPDGIEVDGTNWKEGTALPTISIAARKLFAEKYATFVEGARPTFPLAVWRDLPPSDELRVSVRFLPRSGKIDQAAGIAFGIAEDGSYFGARANALENNVLLFRVVKGKRTVIAEVSNVETKTGEWHRLAIDLAGKSVAVEVDGKRRLEKTLEIEPKGHVGLWSKADSRVTFDGFAAVPILR